MAANNRTMVTCTIYTTPDQLERLKLLAVRRGVSVTSLVRDGIDLVLANPPDWGASG